MIREIDEEKVIHKTQYPFMIKTLKNRNKGKLPQLEKDIFKKKKTLQLTLHLMVKYSMLSTKVRNEARMSALITLF